MPFRALVIALLLSSSQLFAQSRQAVMYVGSGVSAEDRLTILTLAGIVNRDSARLYLRGVFPPWSYSASDFQWSLAYNARGSVQFTMITDLTTLIDRFRPFLSGAVTYDVARNFGNFTGQSFPWQGEYAALIGGLTNRLPLSATKAQLYGLAIADSILLTDQFDGDSSVWIPGRIEVPTHPWNNPALPTEEGRYLTIVDWGISTLLPRCNPSRAFIREITDFAVKHRMFQLNLAGTEDLDFASLSTARADLIERLLLFMQSKNPDRIWHFYGWMRPEPLIQWFAHFGASFHETIQANLSWHSSFAWPKPATYSRASLVREDTVTLENKHYVVFLSSEGDASNWVMTFQAGAWLSPKRGTVPIGWGFNLHLLDECPFVASYYFETATALDGIVSVTSPLGYAYPDTWWGLTQKQAAVDSTRALMNRFKVNENYGYKHYAPGTGYAVYRGKAINNSFAFSNYGQFQSAVGANLSMLFDPQAPTQVPFTTYGPLMYNHCFDGSFYGDVDTISLAKNRIVNLLKTMTRPSFLIGGYQRFRQDGFSRAAGDQADISIALLSQLVDSVKADPTVGSLVEVVTPEMFSVLMRKKMGIVDIAEESTMPGEFALEQNHPNPFNPTTVISYSVAGVGRQSSRQEASGQAVVSMRVYDLLGREVAVLVNEVQEAGSHRVVWSAEGTPSGIYFYRLQAGTFSATKRMVLVK